MILSCRQFLPQKEDSMAGKNRNKFMNKIKKCRRFRSVYEALANGQIKWKIEKGELEITDFGTSWPALVLRAIKHAIENRGHCHLGRCFGRLHEATGYWPPTIPHPTLRDCSTAFRFPAEA